MGRNSGTACFSKRLTYEETRDTQYTEEGKTQKQTRQDGMGGHRNTRLTETTHIAAYGDPAIKGHIHQRAAVETMRDQRTPGLALRAEVQAIPVWIRNLFQVLLDGTRKT